MRRLLDYLLNKYYAVKWYFLLNQPFRSRYSKLKSKVDWLEDFVFETVLTQGDDIVQLDINEGYLERRINRLQGEVNDQDQLIAELQQELRRLTEPTIHDLDQLMRGEIANV